MGKVSLKLATFSGERSAFETITLAPFDASLIDGTVLSATETAWINAYHARVRDVIGPLVDAATVAWLHRATKPVALA